MVNVPERPDTPGPDDPGSGRRLGLDVGTVRIGVALSDRSAILATPLETVARSSRLNGPDEEDIDRLVHLAESNQVVEIIVGLPRDLRNNGSASAKHAADIAERIKRRLPEVPVRYQDERLSTVVATQALRRSGKSASRNRDVIDQAAAVEILQRWLDARGVMQRHAAAFDYESE